MNLDMPIQIKNSEIIKQKKTNKTKKESDIGLFFSWRFKERAPEWSACGIIKFDFESDTFISVSQSICDNL